MTKEESEFLNSKYLLARSSGKSIFNKLFIITKKLQQENQKQKEILDILKPRIYVDDITIKLETLYKCFNEEQYTELKEWKEND